MKLFRKIAIITIVFVSISVVFYDTEAYNVGTNFTLCTSTVDQPACYTTSYPTPTVNWTMTGTGSQVNYQVQIDDDSGFGSPLDSGVVASANKFYTVSSAALNFDTYYYWRVRIQDNYGSWSNWASGDSFTTGSGCCLDIFKVRGNGQTYDVCGRLISDYPNAVLRMAKNGVIYGIELVDVSDANALPIRIKTSAGIKALRKK